MLEYMLDVLQRSPQFQTEVQQQLHHDVPDLVAVCRCCLGVVEGISEAGVALEQLVDENVQVLFLWPPVVNAYYTLVPAFT